MTSRAGRTVRGPGMRAAAVRTAVTGLRWQFWRSPDDQPAWARPVLLGVQQIYSRTRIYCTFRAGDPGVPPDGGSLQPASPQRTWRGEIAGPEQALSCPGRKHNAGKVLVYDSRAGRHALRRGAASCAPKESRPGRGGRPVQPDRGCLPDLPALADPSLGGLVPLPGESVAAHPAVMAGRRRRYRFHGRLAMVVYSPPYPADPLEAWRAAAPPGTRADRSPGQPATSPRTKST
jgi:hypothetical protein